MAVTAKNLTRGGSGTTNPNQTNVFNVDANSLIIFTVEHFSNGNGTPTVPSISDNAGLSWTQKETQVIDGMRLTVFWAYTSIALTNDYITYSSLNGNGNSNHDSNYSVDEFINANGIIPIVQSNSGNSNSSAPSIDLISAPNNLNATLGAVAIEAGGTTITVGTNFIELAKQNSDGSTGIETEYSSNGQHPATWTFTSAQNYAAIIAEIAAQTTTSTSTSTSTTTTSTSTTTSTTTTMTSTSTTHTTTSTTTTSTSTSTTTTSTSTSTSTSTTTTLTVTPGNYLFIVERVG